LKPEVEGRIGFGLKLKENNSGNILVDPKNHGDGSAE
jgi:hypothetical protein